MSLFLASPERAGRPFTGAWIETVALAVLLKPVGRRPFTGAWIETLLLDMLNIMTSRPFTGAWIETFQK